jgi:hypothetical protein
MISATNKMRQQAQRLGGVLTQLRHYQRLKKKTTNLWRVSPVGGGAAQITLIADFNWEGMFLPGVCRLDPANYHVNERPD